MIITIIQRKNVINREDEKDDKNQKRRINRITTIYRL